MRLLRMLGGFAPAALDFTLDPRGRNRVRRRRGRAASGAPATATPAKSDQSRVPAGSELAAALGSCRIAFAGLGLLSRMSSVLTLTRPMFMLEVYARVLPSRSVPTLIGLGILAAVL